MDAEQQPSPANPDVSAPVSGSNAAAEKVETASAGSQTSGVVSEDQVKLALRRVKDPDLHLNIVDLGLVYNIRVDGAVATIDLTLTSPACPSGPSIIGDIEQEVRKIAGVENVQVNLVWAPFWTPDKIEPRVRAYLGL